MLLYTPLLPAQTTNSLAPYPAPPQHFALTSTSTYNTTLKILVYRLLKAGNMLFIYSSYRINCESSKYAIILF